MELSSMASFSDAHECDEIPIIAAAAHRLILPRQSQIWAVARREHTPEKLYYRIAAGFLGRLCFSGDFLGLSDDKWSIIGEGVRFYKMAAPIIDHGYSRFYGPKLKSWRMPSGWQGVVRQSNGKLLAVVHTFARAPAGLRIAIPTGYSLAGR
jgi:alpha-galactosidase